MDSFDLDMQRDKFIKIFDNNIGERDGKEALREWLLSDNCDFFIAPASTKYHGNYDGGLCEHSIDVYEMAVRLESLYREDIRKQYLVLNRPYDHDQFMESLTIASLFHDLCKTNFYKTRISGRNNSTFTVDEQLPFGGHGSKSVYVLSKYLKDIIAISNTRVRSSRKIWMSWPFWTISRNTRQTISKLALSEMESLFWIGTR